MKNFLKSKTGIITIIAVAVLVIGGVIWAVLATSDKKSDKEPEREFHVLEDGESEEVSDDGLQIADPEDEKEDMKENGVQFPLDNDGNIRDNTGDNDIGDNDTGDNDTGDIDTGDNDTGDNDTDDEPNVGNDEDPGWGVPY